MTALPKSCCLELPVEAVCTVKDASQDGCKQKVFDLLSSKSLIFAAVAIAVALVQVRILNITESCIE